MASGGKKPALCCGGLWVKSPGKPLRAECCLRRGKGCLPGMCWLSCGELETGGVHSLLSLESSGRDVGSLVCVPVARTWLPLSSWEPWSGEWVHSVPSLAATQTPSGTSSSVPQGWCWQRRTCRTRVKLPPSRGATAELLQGRELPLVGQKLSDSGFKAAVSTYDPRYLGKLWELMSSLIRVSLNGAQPTGKAKGV